MTLDAAPVPQVDSAAMTLVGDRDGSMRRWVDQTSPASASVVVPLLVSLLHPTSVLDVGCGVGAWLAEFVRAGVGDVQGLDGVDVPPADLRIRRERFSGVDLRCPPAPERTYDLVVCLEVAEHLPRESEAALLDFLCAATGRAILFSAAIPGQGGAGHVNEQWPDHWAELFGARGLKAIDVLRPRLWGDERVAWWYRQNMVLFARPALAERLGSTGSPPPRLVHPELFARARAKKPLESHTPRQLFWALRRAVATSLRTSVPWRAR